MKHVHLSEKNPEECIKTNIGGAQNVIKAAFENNVKKVVALSTIRPVPRKFMAQLN